MTTISHSGPPDMHSSWSSRILDHRWQGGLWVVSAERLSRSQPNTLGADYCAWSACWLSIADTAGRSLIVTFRTPRWVRSHQCGKAAACGAASWVATCLHPIAKRLREFHRTQAGHFLRALLIARLLALGAYIGFSRIRYKQCKKCLLLILHRFLSSYRCLLRPVPVGARRGHPAA